MKNKEDVIKSYEFVRTYDFTEIPKSVNVKKLPKHNRGLIQPGDNKRIARNQPCPCGSGVKAKKCSHCKNDSQ